MDSISRRSSSGRFSSPVLLLIIDIVGHERKLNLKTVNSTARGRYDNLESPTLVNGCSERSKKRNSPTGAHASMEVMSRDTNAMVDATVSHITR